MIQPGCSYQLLDCYFVLSYSAGHANALRSESNEDFFYLLHNPFPPHFIKSFHKPLISEACNLGFLGLIGLSFCFSTFNSSGDHFEKENSEAKRKIAELLTPRSSFRTQDSGSSLRIQEVRKHVALDGSFTLCITWASRTQFHFQNNYRWQNENPEAHYQTCVWKDNVRLESTKSQLPVAQPMKPRADIHFTSIPRLISSTERCHLTSLRKKPKS